MLYIIRHYYLVIVYDDTGEVVGTISDLLSSLTNFYYSAGNKYYVTNTPSYRCQTTGVDGEIYINKVGMLTFDEIVYAGGGSISNSNYYLNNNVTTNEWLTLSPYYILPFVIFILKSLTCKRMVI